jgi:hypothetical protein
MLCCVSGMERPPASQVAGEASGGDAPADPEGFPAL